MQSWLNTEPEVQHDVSAYLLPKLIFTALYSNHRLNHRQLRLQSLQNLHL